ncbi:MAG: methyltransferase [Lysobacterales bacterium]
MPGYQTQITQVPLCGHVYQIRGLSDRSQYADPQGQADRAGISSAQWGLFGQIWPAGRVLAESLCTMDLGGRRILELGCGLALSSLMLARRGADITASDNHPLAEQFLAYNAGLNQLPMPVYRDLPWLDSGAELGQFDLILGSDILYEREHAAILAALLQRMSTATAEIIISDPGRGNGGRLITALAAVGFSVSETRMAFSAEDSAPFKGRLLHFRRPAVC